MKAFQAWYLAIQGEGDEALLPSLPGNHGTGNDHATKTMVGLD